MNGLLPVDRFLATLEIVYREGQHLQYSLEQINNQSVSADWVESLEQYPQKAEQLEAFISRFGRMQDTMADMLLPRWLHALAERSGSQIEVLNRAERLGVVSSTEQWLEARTLRNRLVHEYMEDPALFAEDIHLALDLSSILFDAYAQVREYAASYMEVNRSTLPDSLS